MDREGTTEVPNAYRGGINREADAEEDEPERARMQRLERNAISEAYLRSCPSLATKPLCVESLPNIASSSVPSPHFWRMVAAQVTCRSIPTLARESACSPSALTRPLLRSLP